MPPSRTFDRRLAALVNAKAAPALQGGLKGAEKESGSDLTVAEIAAILHFGTKDQAKVGAIPPRPFLNQTMDEHREEFTKLGARLFAATLLRNEGMTLNRALGILGAKVAAEVKKTITAGMKPGNAVRTIRAKGQDKPLIDTGRLLNAITWAVVEGEEDQHHEESGHHENDGKRHEGGT
jgi:phage gpG-like protein